MAFFIQPQAWLLWTVLFFVAVGLVVAGTRRDVQSRSWLILLPRVVVGWALVDNAQDHLWGGWLPSGGGFLQSATSAATRQPLWPLDPAYQGFLANVVVPNGSVARLSGTKILMKPYVRADALPGTHVSF